MSENDSPITCRRDAVCEFGDGAPTIQVLRQLADNLRVLGKATLFCRILLGRQLISIQKNKVWQRIERRDHRESPEGIPVWAKHSEQRYTSWYDFIENGFELITGLHRQTAYSAIKLAHSAVLSTLSWEALSKFKRLANALELVALEEAGTPVTPELMVQAQEMPIKEFRTSTQAARVVPLRTSSALTRVTALLRTTAARDAGVLDDLWAILQDAMNRANEDPVLAVSDIVSAYFSAHKSEIECAASVPAGAS